MPKRKFTRWGASARSVRAHKRRRAAYRAARRGVQYALRRRRHRRLPYNTKTLTHKVIALEKASELKRVYTNINNQLITNANLSAFPVDEIVVADGAVIVAPYGRNPGTTSAVLKNLTIQMLITTGANSPAITKVMVLLLKTKHQTAGVVTCPSLLEIFDGNAVGFGNQIPTWDLFKVPVGADLYKETKILKRWDFFVSRTPNQSDEAGVLDNNAVGTQNNYVGTVRSDNNTMYKPLRYLRHNHKLMNKRVSFETPIATVPENERYFIACISTASNANHEYVSFNCTTRLTFKDD